MESEARKPAARTGTLALALFLLAFALYAQSSSFGFVEYDDPSYVRDNPHLAQGLTAESVRWAFTSTGYAYNWHPLTWLSHALDVQLFGLDAGRAHLVNAFLHALATALLFCAWCALSGRLWPSALVAALFAVHPLRVESVAWIAERKDVLSGVFFALTLLAHARYVREPSKRRYAWVALALAAGLASKPTLVSVPFLLLLLDVWPLRRLVLGRASLSPTNTPSLAPTRPGDVPPRPPSERSGFTLFVEKLPLLALCLAGCVLTLVSQREGGALDAAIPLGARLENAALAYVTYLRQFVWPRDLTFFYPHPALVSPDVARFLPALGALGLLVLLLGAAFLQRRARPWLLVGLSWFLGTLVPMIGLVQVGAMAHADRYAYLAQIGIEVALAWSAAELVARLPRTRVPVTAAALVVLGCLAARSLEQLATWRSSETLFTHALQVTEHNYVAHNNLGLVLGTGGHPDQELAHFEAACEARPRFYEGELNSGKARYQRGEFEAARSAFERAVEADPRKGEPHLCLAFTLERLGRREEARAELARALELEPALDADPRTRELHLRLDPSRPRADAPR